MGHLVLEASRVHAALKAIHEDRRRDLSQFGLQSSSLFSSISSAPSSSSLQPFPLRSNEKLKTIVELTLILSTQANFEQSPLLQTLYVPGSPWLLTQLIK